jgi:hypothetical protein
MIRIEDFLFVENIEPSQAEALIAKYPNLSFNRTDEFYSFFETKGDKLQRAKPKPAIVNGNEFPSDPANDSQILLERLKNFKSSTDYDYVRKYIIKQKVIQESIASNNLNLAKTTLGEITEEELDPFFNFVVRKILTGSESGLLPSENLKNLFDDLTKKTKQTSEINLDDQVVRDELGRIISYKNYLKNRGAVNVPMIDFRFVLDSVGYVIPREFTSIPEAVNAEKFVVQRAEEWASDVTIGADEAVLIEKLKELINEDQRSVPALELKVQSLNNQVESLQQREQSLRDTNDNLVEAIDQLSNEYLTKATEAELKDQEITVLTETIDSTLSNLEANVTSQLEDTKVAFDNLSSKLEEQSKRAQEQAEKQSQAQLDAFREAIDKVVASNTSTTQSGTSGTSGGNTTSGGSSTSGGSGGSNTGGTTGNSSKDGIPPIKEKRLRQQITDAINSPRISLETLEQIALDLSIKVTLPDFTLPRTGTNQRGDARVAQYNTLVREAKSAIKAAVDKIPPTDDAVLITVWTDLKEAGLIVETEGTSGSTSTSGTSGTGGSSTGGTGGRGGGGGTGRNIL